MIPKYLNSEINIEFVFSGVIVGFKIRSDYYIVLLLNCVHV